MKNVGCCCIPIMERPVCSHSRQERMNFPKFTTSAPGSTDSATAQQHGEGQNSVTKTTAPVAQVQPQHNNNGAQIWPQHNSNRGHTVDSFTEQPHQRAQMRPHHKNSSKHRFSCGSTAGCASKYLFMAHQQCPGHSFN
jgi:hypothetical protein